MKIWAAGVSGAAPVAEPGTIVEVSTDGVVVACGEGALRLTQLQKPGGKRLPVREFLTGASFEIGQRFAIPEAAAKA